MKNTLTYKCCRERERDRETEKQRERDGKRDISIGKRIVEVIYDN